MARMSGPPPLVVIAGPTATGKTDLAIRLAESMMGEGHPSVVISADSRQVYRGLDIGTAKVSVADRGRVPHHGLDLVEPDAPFTVADFATHARAVLDEVRHTPGGLAILAGGTGFYLRAVGRGLDTDALPSDPAIRARLEAEAAADGLAPLLARLDELAPIRAATVDRANPRRVVRALEIAELAGDTPLPEALGYGGPVTWIGLDLERTAHRRLIDARARGQFEAGLIEEARALRDRFDPALPAFSAIGYREAWAVLDGELELEAAIDLDAQRNAAFAKRQRTWFRSETDIEWLDVTAVDPLPLAMARARHIADARYPARP